MRSWNKMQKYLKLQGERRKAKGIDGEKQKEETTESIAVESKRETC